MIADALSAAEDGAELTGGLLAFSRKQTLQPKTTDLVATLTELSHLLNRLLGEKVRLKLEHGENLGLVRVDERQFEQVVMNLAVNARDAMPDGGTITINLTSTDDDVTIAIADNGVGMSPNDIPRALARFSQLHPSGVKESAGTGLGLPLAKLLVELHGGHLSIESALGKGTTVRITLPRNR